MKTVLASLAFVTIMTSSGIIAVITATLFIVLLLMYLYM